MAGGVGLNLTAANHLLLLDPAWNPACEAQCFDRTHRMGQKSLIKYVGHTMLAAPHHNGEKNEIFDVLSMVIR